MCKPSAPKVETPEPPPVLPEAPTLPDVSLSETRRRDRAQARMSNRGGTLLAGSALTGGTGLQGKSTLLSGQFNA